MVIVPDTPLRQDIVNRILRLFTWYPILNQTMLTYNMQVPSSRWYNREFLYLLERGTLTAIPPVFGSRSRAQRFCLTADIAQLTHPQANFFGIIELPLSREAVGDNPIAHKILDWLSLYPLLLPSQMAMLGNTTADMLEPHLEALKEAGILCLLETNRSRRSARYYIRELEPYLGELTLPVAEENEEETGGE